MLEPGLRRGADEGGRCDHCAHLGGAHWFDDWQQTTGCDCGNCPGYRVSPPRRHVHEFTVYTDEEVGARDLLDRLVCECGKEQKVPHDPRRFTA